MGVAVYNVKKQIMIIDTIQNASRYFSVHPLFAKAFSFIKETDLQNAADGKSEIEDGLKAIFSKDSGKTAAASVAKFECHNQNIDIQQLRLRRACKANDEALVVRNRRV